MMDTAKEETMVTDEKKQPAVVLVHVEMCHTANRRRAHIYLPLTTIRAQSPFLSKAHDMAVKHTPTSQHTLCKIVVHFPMPLVHREMMAVGEILNNPENVINICQSGIVRSSKTFLPLLKFIGLGEDVLGKVRTWKNEVVVAKKRTSRKKEVTNKKKMKKKEVASMTHDINNNNTTAKKHNADDDSDDGHDNERRPARKRRRRSNTL
jgi:hypothetical protein